ncbi:MAG TPA: RidA family protein, partial [Burkholderiaceae bacterium]|nr:RidA family protein [Burkholderiaceae bacterium]
GASHGNTPIPTGTRVGNMLFSSGIMGADPATGKLPADVSEQVRHAFAHLDSLLAMAGATHGDVGHMTVFLTDTAHREHVNREWLARFPDPHDRPARHTLVKDLAGGMLVQLEIVAVVRVTST